MLYSTFGFAFGDGNQM